MNDPVYEVIESKKLLKNHIPMSYIAISQLMGIDESPEIFCSLGYFSPQDILPPFLGS